MRKLPPLPLKACLHCQGKFQPIRSHAIKKFCSIRCSRRPLALPPKKACEHCGSEFQPTAKYPQQRFCDHSCQWKATRGVEFNTKIARESAKDRGDMLRGRGEGKSYTKLNGRHAHRVTAEQKLGRPLESGEIVHHRDETKTNYEASNLEVLPSQSDHARLHFLGKKKSPEHIAKAVAGRKAAAARRKAEKNASESV